MGISQVPAPSAGNRSWVSLATVTPVNLTNTTSITGLAAYPYYRLTLEQVTLSNNDQPVIRLNNDATSKYLYVNDTSNLVNGSAFTYWQISGAANTTHTQFCEINNTSTLCVMEGFSYGSPTNSGSNNAKGYWWGAAQINRIDVVLLSQTFSGSGSIKVWGSN